MEEKKESTFSILHCFISSMKSPNYHNENTSTTQQALFVTMNFMHIVDILSEKKY